MLLGMDVKNNPRPGVKLTSGDGVDLIATYKKFFYGDQKWKKEPGLSVLDELREILFPEKIGVSGVDAAVEMTPNDYRRDRIQPILDDYYGHGERDTDKERLVYYLSTILFGEYTRGKGELFKDMEFKVRLQLLGIQTSIFWDNEGAGDLKEDFFKFVDQDGNPRNEEMRWSVVIPSFHVLRLEHLSGVRVWDDIYPKNENGVNADYVKAVLGRWVQRFRKRSKQLPYITYPNESLPDDIARLFCEDSLGFSQAIKDDVMQVLNTKERALQMVASLLVRRSFPELPWGERPEWLPWVYPWPNRWKKQDPFVPIPGETPAYNAGAERVYSNPEFSDSVIPSNYTDQEVIDYCRGILEARLDTETQKEVFPGGRVFAQKKALQYRFLLNTLDAEEYDTAFEAYNAARFYSTTATIRNIDYSILAKKVLKYVNYVPPSDETMRWAVNHAEEILKIYFDMNNKEAEKYAVNRSEVKAGSLTSLSLLLEVNRYESQVYVAIAIALREYGPETHVIQYERLLPEAKRIERALQTYDPESSLEEPLRGPTRKEDLESLEQQPSDIGVTKNRRSTDSSPESSLGEPLRGPTRKEDLESLLAMGDEYFGSSPESSLEKSIEESFNPPVGFTYDQWRHKIVLEVEKSLGVQKKTWVSDDDLFEGSSLGVMLKMDKVFEAVKQKLWVLSGRHETAWAPELINFSPAMGMNLDFLLGIIDQIKKGRAHKADFPGNQIQEYFNWEFFRP